MLHPHDLRYDPWTIRILALAQGLIERGHEAIVAYLPKKKIHQHDRLLRTELPDSPSIVALNPRHSGLYANYSQIRSLLEECDVLHIQKCFASVACPGLWAAYCMGKPVHLDWDDNESALADMTAPDGLWAHLIKTWERILPQLVGSISVSSEGIRLLAKQSGFPEERICKIPVGANLTQFHPDCADTNLRSELGIAEDVPLVIYCGQLEGAAYADLAVEAMRIVTQRNRVAHLVVVGGGKSLPGLQARIASERISSVSVTGYIPADEVPRYMASADIALACFEDNPATRCKSPLKIVEYLASGLAIVGSDVGEVREMLGEGGTVVPAGDAQALADGIIGYLDDAESRREHRRLARQRAETEFHWQRSADVLIEAYEKIFS